ncbi:MAG TPA: hypothetical protein VEI02_06640 [Planctomycetota bacterium]|nr:hypothetical protein [Planctomycetota bacterium]
MPPVGPLLLERLGNRPFVFVATLGAALDALHGGAEPTHVHDPAAVAGAVDLDGTAPDAGEAA